MKRTSRRWWLAVASILLVTLTGQAQQSATPQERPKVAVIRFFANIDAVGVSALLQTVDMQYKAGVRRFVILMSSPGGDLLSGFMAYNYLKGLPIELTTFNVGNVDSAAGIVYCAGTKRYAVPESRFVIHEVSLTMMVTAPGNINIDLPSLESQVMMLKSQEVSMAKILAATIGKPQSEAESKIHAQTFLSAQEAKQWGLVQDVRTELFDPADSNLVLAVPPANPSLISSPSPTSPISPQFSYSSGAPTGDVRKQGP